MRGGDGQKGLFRALRVVRNRVKGGGFVVRTVVRRRVGTRLRAVGLGRDHEVSDSLHRKAICYAVRLGPMDMLAPQRGQRG